MYQLWPLMYQGYVCCTFRDADEPKWALIWGKAGFALEWERFGRIRRTNLSGKWLEGSGGAAPMEKEWNDQEDES